MHWSYKAVHYGLKKDGLLGRAFLDDAEIEESLNQYGRSGWELVSLLETTDGVIAFFKQPLERAAVRSERPSRTEEREPPPPPVRPTEQPRTVANQEPWPELDAEAELAAFESLADQRAVSGRNERGEEAPPVAASRPRRAVRRPVADEDEEPASDVGSIRIE
ncbi:MAG: hypothetical protein ACK5PS_13210 [Desulfopila sp.]